MAQINLDTAQRLDIICRKGDTFVLELEFNQSVSVSGWDLQVRPSDTSEGPENIIVSASTSEIVVTAGNEPDSFMTITIPAEDMEIDSGVYVYDLQQVSDGVVKTYLYGIFSVNEDVTVI